MIEFETALKAKLPFIGVHYDDPVNVRTVLQSIAQKTLMALPKTRTSTLGDSYVYWTEEASHITTDMYRLLCETGASCVVINLEKPSMLVFDTGVLWTPVKFYEEYLEKFVAPETIPLIVQVLKGLSVKSAQEVIQLTMARSGSVLPQEVRKTRQMLGGDHPGLTTLDTEYDFYEWPKSLKEWVELNDKYFLDPFTPAKLVPRGLLLAGPPGTGKSLAAMVLAKHWDVPLLRLDVATNLNRYLGESESRIERNLNLIEQSAPCVWLLDEAEKLFTGNEEGTPLRMLSQILWWLQYHKSRVVTVMTTNNLEALPKELYRAERLDKVLHLEKLSMSAARLFVSKVYQSVLGEMPSPKRQKVLYTLLEQADQGTFSPAEVRVLVYECIKEQNWMGVSS